MDRDSCDPNINIVSLSFGNFAVSVLAFKLYRAAGTFSNKTGFTEFMTETWATLKAMSVGDADLLKVLRKD